MNKLKKLVKVCMVAFMAFTTMSVANASEETKASIKINKDGTTYSAYRVLDINTNTTSGKDISVYSENTNFSDFFKSTYSFSADKGIMKGVDIIDPSLSDEGLNSSKTNYKQNEKMEALSVALISYIKGKNLTPTTIQSNQVTPLAQGYYIIVENATTISSSSEVGVVPSKAMIVSVINGDTRVIDPKQATVTIKKTADDKAVSESTIGKDINYKINSTIPTYASNFTNIKYNITDVLSEGLTYKTDTLNITVGGTKIVANGKVVLGNESFFVNTPAFTGQNLSVEFHYDALKTAAIAGQEVVVTYTAKLNEKAVLTDPNTNTATLNYSNQPDGTTTGIPSKTETYTYGIKIKKIDGNTGDASKVLEGAKFRIEKSGDASFTPMEVTSGADGIIKFDRLGDGIYTLTEVTAPNGYALLKGAITVEITHKDNFKSASFKVSGDNNVVSSTNSDDAVTLDLQIKNYKGISLPETGGMGTTVFMIGGAALLVVAGALLVVYTKKTKKA